MRIFMCALLVLSVAAMASDRTGGSGGGNPWSSRGSYDVVNVMAGGLTGAYGMSIKDSTPNSIWIHSWDEMINMEFDMVTGSATGITWDITGGVDPDDQAFCEYASGNQFFMTDYSASWFSVFDEDGGYLYDVDGPAGYTNLFGIGAGDGYVYVSSPNEDVIAWGSYTGASGSITWSELPYSSVYGLAVHDGYLFVGCGLEGEDNIFIHALNPDGSPVATPEWSCVFAESAQANGGIDFDGEYLWVYPQNDFLYQLDIDWSPQALEGDTWGGIKATF